MAQYNYPSNNVDGREKASDKWLLQYAKAFWFDTNKYTPDTILFGNRANYDLWRAYGMGQQGTGAYKGWLGVDKKTNKSFHNISWAVYKYVSHLRSILIKKNMDVGFNIAATPIDPTGGKAAKSEFARIKTALLMRKQIAAMAEQNPQMAAVSANHPATTLKSTDPQDLEELEWRVHNGEQFNRSMNAELVINLAFYQNNFNQLRKGLATDLVDWGITAVVDGLDENNEPTLTQVDVRYLITNRFINEDGSDITRWGRLYDVDKEFLVAKGYDRSVLNSASVSEYGSKGYGVSADSGKCRVLQFEVMCSDTKVWEISKKKGLQVSQAPLHEAKKKDRVTKQCQNWYTAKWVIGTDYIYDCGLKQDMKRTANREKRSYSESSLHLIAYDFHEMKALGFMERVVSLLDDLQVTFLKRKALISAMIPAGYAVDINALISVALENPNTLENMTPLDLLDMYQQRGILVFEGKDLGGATGNYQPIREQPNTGAIGQITEMYNETLRIKADIKEMWGLNEATDGSSIGDRKSTFNLNVGIQNTNNALWPLINAQKTLIESAAKAMYKRVQQSIRRNGTYKGWMPALNSNVPMFIEADDDMDLMDAGIVVEVAPSEQERAIVQARVQSYVEKGLLAPGSETRIMNCSNLKMMEGMLSRESDKWLERKQREALELQQQNGQVQIQSAQAAEQAKQQTLQMDLQGRMQLAQLEADLELRNQREILTMKGATQEGANAARVHSAAVQADGKIDAVRVGKGLPAKSDEVEVVPEGVMV